MCVVAEGCVGSRGGGARAQYRCRDDLIDRQSSASCMRKRRVDGQDEKTVRCSFVVCGLCFVIELLYWEIE